MSGVTGPYHDFWLIRAGDRRYEDYWDLLGRRDAPVRFPDDLLWYFQDTLDWVPTVIPSLPGLPVAHGLNWTGPTVIERAGGALFRHVWASWASLFAHAPERLTLRGAFGWQWPFEDAEHTLHVDQLLEIGGYDRLDIDRTWLIDTVQTLARFGEQAASGESFVLHLGI